MSLNSHSCYVCAALPPPPPPPPTLPFSFPRLALVPLITGTKRRTELTELRERERERERRMLKIPISLYKNKDAFCIGHLHSAKSFAFLPLYRLSYSLYVRLSFSLSLSLSLSLSPRYSFYLISSLSLPPFRLLLFSLLLHLSPPSLSLPFSLPFFPNFRNKFQRLYNIQLS